MIRFSAALVAVAIGVLIGGIATSKLLLVYIAIGVSAVALVALAIGVVVKREELFGEGQGLVPAGAGAAPGRSARAGESQDQHPVAAEQRSPAVSVPPSAPFQGPTAGHGSAFGGTAFGGHAFGETAQAAAPPKAAANPSAPPKAAANPSAPRQASDGHGGTRAGDPMPPWEAQSARDQWSSPPWPSSTAGGPPPDWMPSGRGVSEPVGQAETTAPSLPSAVPPAPPRPSSTAPEPASPNWFAPKARSADAAPPATDAPADAASADEDDDWPTRYSWLDEEPDESPREAEAPAGQDPTREVAASDVPVGDAPAGDTAPAETAAPAATDDEREPGLETETESEQEPGPAEPETEDADGEPSSAGQAGPDTAAAMVAVLPGVPRYHQLDCVLIRFMPDDDIQRLPVAQAKADGCTPCAACQPAD